MSGGPALPCRLEVRDKARLMVTGELAKHCSFWSRSRQSRVCEAETAPGRLRDLFLNKREGFHRNFAFILNRF